MNSWVQKSLILASTLACTAVVAKKPAQQQEVPSEPIGVYFGGFGGWIFPYDVTVIQRGTAFFLESTGGALGVEAKGTAPGKTKGFGGLHIGYEWMKKISPGFRLAPAVELEGYYFTNNRKATVENPPSRLTGHTLTAHEFIDTLPMRVGMLLANGILEFNNDYLSPYVGVGVGVGFVSVHDADSLQIDPMEAGVNHFNSNPDDFSTLFATQVKAGLRYRFLKHYRLFTEYRFAYLTSSSFTFGSTDYPTHATTSPWTVKFNGMGFNAVAFGIDFIF